MHKIESLWDYKESVEIKKYNLMIIKIHLSKKCFNKKN